MKIKELIEYLQKEENKGITDIEFESYDGNTIFKLSDLNIADVENETLRLQLEEKTGFTFIKKGFFPVTALHRNDIIQAFEDTHKFGEERRFMNLIREGVENITDPNMKWLSEKMSDSFWEDNGTWELLRDLVETNFNKEVGLDKFEEK